MRGAYLSHPRGRVLILGLTAWLIGSGCAGGGELDELADGEGSTRGSLSMTSPLTVDPTNPRYFRDHTGKPAYLVGSHTWNSLQDGAFFTAENQDPPPAFNFASYLSFLASRNHNFIRLWRFELPKFYYWLDIDNSSLRTPASRMGYQFSQPHPWPRTGPGTALDGKPKFDLSKLDPAYFSRLRTRVAAARDKGIYVSVMLFEGGELRGPKPWSWQAHPFNGKNNINGVDADANHDGVGIEVHTLQGSVKPFQEAYIRKVVDTVNDLNNVLYEVGNEFAFSTANTQWQYWVVSYLKQYEATKAKQHPVGMVCSMHHPWKTGVANDTRNAALFDGPADWISPGYTAGDGYDDLSNLPASDGSKVILLDSDHLWGIGGDRSWVWKSFTRGHNPIFMDTLPEITEHILDYSKSVEIRAAMGDTRAYAKRLDFARTVPQGQLTSTGYALAKPGSEYLVYQPGSGSFTVSVISGTYSYEWFNPVTRAVAGSGSLAVTTGSRSFVPPFSGSAVLYLKAAASQGPICGAGGCEAGETCASCPADCGSCPLQQPVAWWKFDETAGSLAADSSGQGNAGILINGPRWTPGMRGGGIELDGVDDRISLPASATLSMGNKLSVAVWVYSRSNGFARIVEHGGVDSAPYYEYAVVLREGKHLALGVSDGTFQEVPSAGTVPTNTWTHLVTTWDGASIRYYINGVATGTPIPQSGSIAQQNNVTAIGARVINGLASQHFNGMLDDLRIYNRALTSQEIQALYQGL